MGSVTGIIGAGGNVGAVCFGMAFRNVDNEKAFMIMGCSIIVSSFLSVFIHIEEHAGLLTGRDQLVDKETGEIADMNSRKRGKECDEEDDDDDPLL
jgi:nitrate/nitrite transporter NarK